MACFMALSMMAGVTCLDLRSPPDFLRQWMTPFAVA
jgi:hypothetical protein